MNGVAQLDTNCLPVGSQEVIEETNWYAVRTRSRHEKLVARQLQNLGIQAYLPLVTKINQWSDRRKQIEAPLFSGYAFVRLNPSSGDRIRVLQTQGVVNFVGVQGAGIAIPDQEIENIHTLLTSQVAYQERPYLHVGQRVRVCGGALDGLEGILTAENNDRSVVISIASIQRSLSVRVAGYNVEPL